jgi:flagellar protein FlbT
MDPSATPGAMTLSRKLIDAALAAFETKEIIAGLKTVDDLIKRSRNFDAMKTLRGLFPLEQTVVFPAGQTAASHAA